MKEKEEKKKKKDKSRSQEKAEEDVNESDRSPAQDPQGQSNGIQANSNNCNRSSRNEWRERKGSICSQYLPPTEIRER